MSSLDRRIQALENEQPAKPPKFIVTYPGDDPSTHRLDAPNSDCIITREQLDTMVRELEKTFTVTVLSVEYVKGGLAKPSGLDAVLENLNNQPSL